jgi:hypothetical protein
MMSTLGDVIIYTEEGERDQRNGRQIADTPGKNLALAEKRDETGSRFGGFAWRERRFRRTHRRRLNLTSNAD